MVYFFLIKSKDVASYADDTTPYETGGNSAYVIHNLEVSGNTLLKWFNDNSMKANPGKYQSYLIMTPIKSQSEIKQFPVVNAKNFWELK